MPLVLDTFSMSRPFKGQINLSSLRQSMSFKTTLLIKAQRGYEFNNPIITISRDTFTNPNIEC